MPEPLTGIPALSRALSVRRLPGALRTTSYAVELPEGAVVARVRESAAAARDEYSALQGLEGSSVAPQALGVADNVIIVEWLNGSALQPGQLPIERVVHALQRLHESPLLGRRLDLPAAIDGYRQRAGLAAAIEPAVRRAFDLIAADGSPMVPCHGDLVPANVIDDGSRVRFIDWAYAVDAPAFADLSYLWLASDVPDDELGRLVTAYDGAPDRLPLARAWALAWGAAWEAWWAAERLDESVDDDSRVRMDAWIAGRARAARALR